MSLPFDIDTKEKMECLYLKPIPHLPPQYKQVNSNAKKGFL
jgi:hypothetical protein